MEKKFMKLNKKFVFKILLILGILISVGSFVFVQINYVNAESVDNGQGYRLRVGGVGCFDDVGCGEGLTCFKNNGCSSDIYIPRKTYNEYLSFKSNHPSCVMIGCESLG